jgi:uncharacterized protein YjbI with pentapeptide repeats
MRFTAGDLTLQIQQGRTHFTDEDMRGADLEGLNIDGRSLLFAQVNFEKASLNGSVFLKLTSLAQVLLKRI